MNRSYRNRGFTAKEVQIWPPKRIPISFAEKAFVFAMACAVIATLVHFTIEKKYTPIVEPNISLYSQPDDVQEAAFCQQIMNGVKVHGANASQIELHCLVHG